EFEGAGGLCFFCPGNESTTPPEISRVEEGGKWTIRVFPNKFPAVTLEEGERTEYLMPAYGEHEVIVETPEHDNGLSDLSVEQLAKVLRVYSEREEALLKKQGIAYVLLFKNWGKEAGASLPHTHTQAVSLPSVPKLVKEEAEAAEEYAREKGACPFCKTIEKEVKSDRRIFEDDCIAAFTPYASRVPMEAWIMPIRHVGRLKELKDKEYESLAMALKQVLEKLKRLNDTPYNYYIHSSPAGADLHLHIEVLPKMATWAGFEIGSEVYINTLAPESAAEYYRQK
ncbi:MAG: DUF4931 domain-containing protein, partial [Candidatus Altiarchaeota archaeon]|nr:DUF4931 domain-containing protein [Candidatus Altiarchaeota archaeon]